MMYMDTAEFVLHLIDREVLDPLMVLEFLMTKVDPDELEKEYGHELEEAWYYHDLWVVNVSGEDADSVEINENVLVATTAGAPGTQAQHIADLYIADIMDVGRTQTKVIEVVNTQERHCYLSEIYGPMLELVLNLQSGQWACIYSGDRP